MIRLTKKYHYYTTITAAAGTTERLGWAFEAAREGQGDQGSPSNL